MADGNPDEVNQADGDDREYSGQRLDLSAIGFDNWK